MGPTSQSQYISLKIIIHSPLARQTAAMDEVDIKYRPTTPLLHNRNRVEMVGSKSTRVQRGKCLDKRPGRWEF